MGFMSILASVFSLADTSLSYLGEKQRLKYRDKLYNLKKNILEEEMKPLDQQDDVNIERWYSELPLVLEAINVQLQLENAKKK